MLTLRPYQQAGLTAVERAVGVGMRRPLVAWATGLGKTVLAAHWLQRREGRALLLAHRDELLRQAADKLQAIAPDLSVGLVKAEQDDVGADVVLGSVQTLAKPARLVRLVDAGGFVSVVVDEAHHAAADSYRAILSGLGAWDDGGPVVLGITATPNRADGRGAVWERIVHAVGLKEGIRQGYLVDLRAKRVRLEADWSDLEKVRGDISDAEAERVLLDAEAPDVIAQAIQEHAAGRRCLVFTPTVAVAAAIAGACGTAGLDARMVDGTTPITERQETYRWLRAEGTDTRVLTNCAVLTEGFDEPRVDCIVMARPTLSPVLYQQCIGRGTRPYPGKDDCLILDVVGAVNRHDLQTAAELLSVEMTAAARDALTDGSRTLLQLEDDGLVPGRPVAEPIDPWARRPFVWVRAAGGFAISLGDRAAGFLFVSEASEGWSVWHQQPAGGRSLYRGRDLGYALGIAEDRVRKDVPEVLTRPDARWRKKPATDKQRAALAKWRLPVPEVLTCGEAGEALTRAVVEKTLRGRTG